MNVFDQMTREDRWLGFGYLGGRRIALSDNDPEAPAQPERVAQIDAYLLGLDLDYETLFAWANSKLGRMFADTVFGGYTLERALREGLAPPPPG